VAKRAAASSVASWPAPSTARQPSSAALCSASDSASLPAGSMGTGEDQRGMLPGGALRSTQGSMQGSTASQPPAADLPGPPRSQWAAPPTQPAHLLAGSTVQGRGGAGTAGCWAVCRDAAARDGPPTLTLLVQAHPKVAGGLQRGGVAWAQQLLPRAQDGPVDGPSLLALACTSVTGRAVGNQPAGRLRTPSTPQ